MRDIWSIFVISIIGLIIFSGVGLINDYMFDKGQLNDESTIAYLNWNSKFVSLDAESQIMLDSIVADELNKLEEEPDVNTLDSFVREFGEAKQRAGALRNGLRIITNLPAMLFTSLPFVTYDDVKYYVILLNTVIAMIIGIAIYNALFSRRVDK